MNAMDVFNRWDEMEQDEFREALDRFSIAVVQESSRRVAEVLSEILAIGERAYMAKFGK